MLVSLARRTRNAAALKATHTELIAYIALAFLVSSSDFSLISVALPSIGRELHLTPETLSMVVASYTLSFAGFLMLSGGLTDRYGRRRCCAGGLLLYIIGAVVSASAVGLPMLLASRSLQGFASAIVAPASFSLLNTSLPDGPVRRRGYGMLASAQAASLIVGSVFGGGIITLLGWRAAFLVSTPFAVAALVLALRSLPVEPHDHTRPRPDVLGALFVTVGTSLVLGSVGGVGRSGMQSSSGLMLLAGLLSFFALFMLERRLKNPLVPPQLFLYKNVTATNLALLCCFAGVAGTFVLPSLYMQRVLGFSAAQSGLAMLPQAFAGMLTGRFLTFSMARVSLRKNILAGLLAAASGLAVFAWLPMLWPSGGYSSVILLPLLVSALAGPYVGMLLMAGCTMSAPPAQQGAASALAMTTQQMGLALGISIVLGVTGHFELAGASLAAAIERGYLAAMTIVLVGAVCIFVLSQAYEAKLITAESEAG